MTTTVTLNGNLGNDAVFTHTTNKKPVVRFSVADNQSYTDGNGVRHSRDPIWRQCVMYGDRATEHMASQLKKGMWVQVTARLGEPVLRTKKDDDGNETSRIYQDFIVLSVMQGFSLPPRKGAAAAPPSVEDEESGEDADIPL